MFEFMGYRVGLLRDSDKGSGNGGDSSGELTDDSDTTLDNPVSSEDDDGQTQNDPMKEFFALADEDPDEDLSDDDSDPDAEAADDSEGEKKPQEQAKPETPPAEKKPEEKKEAADAEKEPKKEGAENAGEKKPEETPQAPKPSTETPALTAEQIAEQQRTHRAEAEKLLAEQHFKFSDEEYEQYEENPREYLPKMAARLYMDAVTNSMAHMMQLFPQLLDSSLQARDRNSVVENQFYEMWPKLDRTKHDQTVRMIAHTYRQHYPNLTPQEFMQHVGAQAMIALKIAPDETPPKTNGTVQTPTPHKPAGVAAAAPQTVKVSDNFYTELAIEEEADAN